uniref:Uncharacterized protein n=1 Tax=Mycena chlorophos TaxID=658473 RepID=A0ABQ0L499_MYCCL|nr:predicted protein [Mycena chlorophos]
MTFLRALATAFIAVSAALALVPISHTPSGLPIYEAPSGSRVLQNGTDMVVYAPNGTRLHVFENVVGARTSTPTGTGPLRVRQTETVGQVFTTFGANDTLQAFNGTFVVPSAPATFDSQLMYLSQGVTTLDDNGVPASFLGAALQYGGSSIQGGSFYTGFAFIEWLPNGGYLSVTLTGSTGQLNVSDTVGISITYQGIDSFPGEAPYYLYNVAFTGPDADRFAQMEVGQQVLPTVVGFRAEEEGVSGPSDYPSGPLVFKDIQMQLTNGVPENVEWEVEGAAATGIGFEVVNGGSGDVEIKFVFPDDS